MITRRAWLGGIAASLLPGRVASARILNTAVHRPLARWPDAEFNGEAFYDVDGFVAYEQSRTFDFRGRVEPRGRTAERIAAILSAPGYFVVRPPYVPAVEFRPRCVPTCLDIGDALGLTDDRGRFVVSLQLWSPRG